MHKTLLGAVALDLAMPMVGAHAGATQARDAARGEPALGALLRRLRGHR
ncbi:MAG: hypothetical protein QOI20_907 [Acidimicrobiaceae bacterium]|jgi:hypothetical protein|nr:hypothetical protein [Acidimicrobiaceae bacterium]